MLSQKLRFWLDCNLYLLYILYECTSCTLFSYSCSTTHLLSNVNLREATRYCPTTTVHVLHAQHIIQTLRILHCKFWELPFCGDPTYSCIPGYLTHLHFSQSETKVFNAVNVLWHQDIILSHACLTASAYFTRQSWPSIASEDSSYDLPIWRCSS